MHVLHHILFSRVLAVVAFGMFLVLTPRAWVEPESHGLAEEVPVDVLEQPSQCLWCDPLPAAKPCNDAPDAEPRRRMWLNPDEPIVLPLDVPCSEDAPAPHA